MKKGRPASVKASLKMLGKTYQSSGKDFLSAIEKLKPETYKVYGVLTITKGKEKREKILSRRMMYRLFGPQEGVFKAVALKQIGSMFQI